MTSDSPLGGGRWPVAVAMTVVAVVAVVVVAVSFTVWLQVVAELDMKTPRPNPVGFTPAGSRTTFSIQRGFSGLRGLPDNSLGCNISKVTGNATLYDYASASRAQAQLLCLRPRTTRTWLQLDHR